VSAAANAKQFYNRVDEGAPLTVQAAGQTVFGRAVAVKGGVLAFFPFPSRGQEFIDRLAAAHAQAKKEAGL
jgi:hypothetical protein